jgi:hypothetical protein
MWHKDYKIHDWCSLQEDYTQEDKTGVLCMEHIRQLKQRLPKTWLVFFAGRLFSYNCQEDYKFTSGVLLQEDFIKLSLRVEKTGLACSLQETSEFDEED